MLSSAPASVFHAKPWETLPQLPAGLSSRLTASIEMWPQHLTTLINISICSDTAIEFEHRVSSEGDLLIDDLQLEQCGNFSCTVTNKHGHDSVSHQLTVHGESDIVIII